MALLTCQDITLGYESTKIVEHLSFQIHKGDYLCVVGENGSGKSTLMKTCLNLLPPLLGKVVLGDGLKAIEIGYLPQQTAIQKDFPASCWEIVLSGCLNRCGLHPFYSKNQKQLAAENMKRLGIIHLSNRCYSELSGGQQQRVLLARALCATGKMLLLDEPVAGLDPKVSAEMYEIIQQLNREGITIMMISHDIAAVIRYATHILHIGNQSAFWGTKEEYLRSAFASYLLSSNQEVSTQ